ncbi:MAG: hypothetical protein ACOX69_04470 [Coriobacteriales bacterium]|jgi:hypothetical protein
MRGKKFRNAGACLLSAALAATMVVVPAGGIQNADAATSSAYWSAPSSAATVDSNNLKTYGVRAGSAGPDFLGISNTNFDVTGSKPTSNTQTALDGDSMTGTYGAGLAIWATSVNENVNPYYANLYYNAMTDGTATAATTWSSNNNSWGDSNGVSSTINGTSTATIAGLEFESDIIFGANKTTSWQNFNYSSTTIGQAVANKTTGYDSYDPTFVNNDSTNLWTQIYTLNNLAKTADKMKSGTSKTTRYDSNSATTGALSYEKALRGNLLYIASQIDKGKVEKKTVAYLYAIDENDTGYFFIPQASGLTKGTDTGETNNSAEDTADSNYAANNGTIDLDYMDTLPFITNTFTGGTKVSGGIVMKVEDIYKTNPATSVSSSQTSALKDVDTIIFNTTVNTDLQGTSGGKNSSGINNAAALTESSVTTWAKKHGYTGSQVIAGDDFGTSSNQGFGSVETTADGMSPMLYCKRNYTTDKPARAAWAFSKVYPELYPNEDASYAYWVDKVYHINTADVATVVKYMTNQSDSVEYSSSIASTLESHYQTGLNWWMTTGRYKSAWNKYAYYNGSTRASYYDSLAKSEELTNTIGIFAPTSTWAAKATATGIATGKKATAGKGASKATYKVTSNTKNTATYVKCKSSKKSVTVPAKVTIKGKAYKVTAVAAKAFKGKKATKVTLGKNVKTVKKGAFKGSKVKTVVVKTTKLTKKSVKGSLKGSKVKTLKVNVGKTKADKKYVKKYKKVFKKKTSGKKVTVKR